VFCQNCGQEIADAAVICVKCGVATSNQANINNNVQYSNELIMLNEQKRDQRIIKIGFDWPSFFSAWICGIPHFIRGQTTIGIMLLVLSLGSYLPFMSNMSEGELAFASLTLLIFFVGLSIYMGSNGRKLLVKHLLENNYKFEDESSELVDKMKKKWGII